jgi:hypothetical protein
VTNVVSHSADEPCIYQKRFQCIICELFFFQPAIYMYKAGMISHARQADKKCTNYFPIIYFQPLYLHNLCNALSFIRKSHLRVSFSFFAIFDNSCSTDMIRKCYLSVIKPKLNTDWAEKPAMCQFNTISLSFKPCIFAKSTILADFDETLTVSR